MQFVDVLDTLEVPVLQAPLAGVQDHRLAAAVADAGGLGALPAAMLSAEGLELALESMQRVSPGKPLNVNFFCHAEPTIDAHADQAWRETLLPYFVEFGVDPSEIAAGPARRPFDHNAADILESRPPTIVSFHFGLPAEDLVARVRGWGSLVLSTATTVAEAVWLEQKGVDAIIAQGLEAGGHRGDFLGEGLQAQQSTRELVAAIAHTVALPVIAAGGIAKGSDIASMLAAGAVAVQVGTAFLCATEATTSAIHRRALGDHAQRGTVLTNVFTGRNARGLVNRLIRELGDAPEGVPAFPLAASALAPLRAAAEALGRDDFSPLWSGVRPPLLHDQPAAAILASLAP